MSKLALYTQFNLKKPYKVSEDTIGFSSVLAEVGVCYEKWPTVSHLPNAVMQETDVFKIYHEQIERVKKKFAYSHVDLTTMKSSDAFAVSVRGRYLSEHTHTEDEARFFLAGKILLYLNIENDIHILECTRGDFVVIPAGMKHWMDIGPHPEFAVLRWFNTENTFKNDFTNSVVAESTPRWEAIYNEAHFGK